MDRTDQLVRSYMASPNSETLNSVVSEIVAGEARLLDIVKALGTFLTAEDETIRAMAVGFLSEVLTKCPAGKIMRQSARVLTIFYCEKLEDTETIIPALNGLVPLASNPSFFSEEAVTTVKAIFQHIAIRAHVQSTRLLVFIIIDTLIARHREALKALGNEFLRGYIDLAEGEKDPRNLLLAFSIARVILVEFETSDYVDDLFNITFCYFPVTFRPSPDDPYGITPDDLRLALRSCLNATPRFGPLAMPLFLEKLSVGSGNIKRDILQTITSCLPVYGIAVSRDYASRLWSAIKVEVFQPIDSETADCALGTVQAIIRVVYPAGDKPDLDGDLEGLGKSIIEECLEVLKEPEKRKAKPAIQVLASLVHTTPFITRYTLSQVVPHLIGLFREPDEFSNRPATLTALGMMIQAVCDAFHKPNSFGEVRAYAAERPLEAFKDEILGVFIAGLKNPASTSSALIGLKALVKISGLPTEEELGFVVHSINEMLSVDEGISKSVRIEILEVLSSVSLLSSKQIEETTLPLLFSSLFDTAPPREADAERAKYRRILTSLSKLCIQPPLFETFIIRLSTKLDLICASTTSSDVDIENNAAYAHSILSSISSVLTNKVEAGHVDLPKYLDRLVPRIYNLCIASAISLEQHSVATVMTHPRLIQIAAKVVAQIVRTVSISRQQLFADSLFKAWFNGEISGISDGHQRLPPTMTFTPTSDCASAAQKMLMPLFSAPVITFHKEVCFPVDDEASFLSMLLTWSLDKAESEVQATAAIHIVASTVNKHAEELSVFVTSQLDSFWRNISDHDHSPDRRRRAVRAWTWLTKALVVRNHDKAQVYIDRIFTLFEDGSLAWDAAKAIGDIGNGGEGILTKTNFAILKILSVQKFFNAVLPRIIEGINSADSTSSRTPYLVSLASLIKTIPKNMYIHEMPKLMPLLLRGLDLQDSDMRTHVVDTLYGAARDASTSSEVMRAAISEHAPSLVTAMLKNCTKQDLSLSRLRQAALRCLGVLPHVVRYDILHPYKSQVIRDLGRCLDDPKRDVRKEAVDARHVTNTI